MYSLRLVSSVKKGKRTREAGDSDLPASPPPRRFVIAAVVDVVLVVVPYSRTT